MEQVIEISGKSKEGQWWRMEAKISKNTSNIKNEAEKILDKCMKEKWWQYYGYVLTKVTDHITKKVLYSIDNLKQN